MVPESGTGWSGLIRFPIREPSGRTIPTETYTDVYRWVWQKVNAKATECSGLGFPCPEGQVFGWNAKVLGRQLYLVPMVANGD